MPFETEKLLFIDDILSTTIKYLEQKKEDDFSEIIQEAVSLRNVMHLETKKVVISKLSKIFAKIKKKGIPLFKDFLKELKKKSLKK